ncbi:MAG: hypothetical protein JRN54_10190 [Nitrososphaerota archaeon]|nr:hypothetical protein [Nitrososphaerota archaeon]
MPGILDSIWEFVNTSLGVQVLILIGTIFSGAITVVLQYRYALFKKAREQRYLTKRNAYIQALDSIAQLRRNGMVLRQFLWMMVRYGEAQLWIAQQRSLPVEKRAPSIDMLDRLNEALSEFSKAVDYTSATLRLPPDPAIDQFRRGFTVEDMNIMTDAKIRDIARNSIVPTMNSSMISVQLATDDSEGRFDGSMDSLVVDGSPEETVKLFEDTKTKLIDVRTKMLLMATPKQSAGAITLWDTFVQDSLPSLRRDMGRAAREDLALTMKEGFWSTGKAFRAGSPGTERE